MKKKFETTLRARLLLIVGKRVEIFSRPSNCIQIILKGGKEHHGSVKSVEDDHFIMEVTHTGGGEEQVCVRMSEVASFTMD